MSLILFLIGFYATVGLLIWASFLIEMIYRNNKATEAILNHLGLEVGDYYVLKHIDKEE